jgi:ribonuclease Z
MANLERAYAADIRIRIADEKLPPEGAEVVADEFAKDGVVYEKRGVKVTAFEVDHGEDIKPAYGYRVDFNGRSVAISGDTRFNENVIKYGTGVDLLIHEVGSVRPEIANDPAVRRTIRRRKRQAGCSAGHIPSSPSTLTSSCSGDQTCHR